MRYFYDIESGTVVSEEALREIWEADETLQEEYPVFGSLSDLQQRHIRGDLNMKKYLIAIEHNKGNTLYTMIHGDCPTSPFGIAGRLWDYKTPWNAAQRLERIAKKWESTGANVTRVYGTVQDMPVTGNNYNAAQIIEDFTT